MANNQETDQQDDGCGIEFPVVTPPTSGSTVELDVCVRDGGLSRGEGNERLIEIETPRLGTDSNWIQFGPTTQPSDGLIDGNAYWWRDTDGDGHGEVGIQARIPVAAPLMALAAGSGVVAAATGATGVGAPVAGVFGVIAAAAGGAAFFADKMGLNYDLGFNFEPATATNWLRQQAEEFKDDIPNRFPGAPWEDGISEKLREGFSGGKPQSLVERFEAKLEMNRVHEAYARLKSL